MATLKRDERGIIIDSDRREVRRNGKPLKIRPKEYMILCVLVDANGSAMSRELLMTKIWPHMINEIDSRTLDQHIARIRRLLGRSSIKTVTGYGYRWDGK